jgi:hypothetical protein
MPIAAAMTCRLGLSKNPVIVLRSARALIEWQPGQLSRDAEEAKCYSSRNAYEMVNADSLEARDGVECRYFK